MRPWPRDRVLLRGGRAALIRLPDRGAQAGLVEHPADRGLTRHRPPDPHRVAHRRWQVTSPLADRHERPCPGQHRAHRDPQHHHQPMADPSSGPRVGQLRHRDQQAGRHHLGGPARPIRRAPALANSSRNQRRNGHGHGTTPAVSRASTPPDHHRCRVRSAPPHQRRVTPAPHRNRRLCRRPAGTPQPIWSATRWIVPCVAPSSLRSCRTSRTARALQGPGKVDCAVT